MEDMTTFRIYDERHFDNPNWQPVEDAVLEETTYYNPATGKPKNMKVWVVDIASIGALKSLGYWTGRAMTIDYNGDFPELPWQIDLGQSWEYAE